MSVQRVGDFHDRSGTYTRKVGQYTGPTSYATGGDSFTPESVGLGKIEHLDMGMLSNGTAVLFGFYNRTTKKIVWYSATGTEVTAAVDLSGYTATFEAIGK